MKKAHWEGLELVYNDEVVDENTILPASCWTKSMLCEAILQQAYYGLEQGCNYGSIDDVASGLKRIGKMKKAEIFSKFFMTIAQDGTEGHYYPVYGVCPETINNYFELWRK